MPRPHKGKEGTKGYFTGRGRGRGDGGVADGVAVDDELDAAVALAAFGRVVGGDRLRLAEAVSGNGRRGDALLGEKVADGIGAALGKLLIEIVAANAVGVALDLERETGMREVAAGDCSEFFAGAARQRVSSPVNAHVGHRDADAATGMPGRTNGIQ